MIIETPTSILVGIRRFPIRRNCCAHARRSLFDLITGGKLRVPIGGEYPLADAARAHADMESRKTTGKLLLVP